MKKYVSITLFIFWAIVVAVLVVGLIFSNQPALRTSSQPSATASNTQTTTKIPDTPTVGQPLKLTMAEVAKHSSANDCWQMISGNVYDLTPFASSHSGGDQAITNSCGQDATQAFLTKEGRGGHRSGDMSILDQYKLGPLVVN
ncbi:MAG: cytochrome b5-like heme/steroid binding domain-containing protein [bacterium]